jgi:hypothetical protein
MTRLVAVAQTLRSLSTAGPIAQAQQGHATADDNLGAAIFEVLDLNRVRLDRAHCASLTKWPNQDRTVQTASDTMEKEEKTAQELADMILAEINVGGTHIKVHADPIYGWHPTVVAVPEKAHALQKEAENIAVRLRTKYKLKTEIATE